MKKLKAILLTEGMHGMISQVEGMAKALNSNFYHKIVRLKFPWIFLPPKLTPISDIILKDKTYFYKNELPDLIISCGRKSVIPSILLKKNNKKLFTIHIQDPKVNFKNFDLIVSPMHDNLKGENIINSAGAIHYITKSEIDKSKQYLQTKINTKNLVSLILGGPNKYYSFDDKEIISIFKNIKEIYLTKGYKLVVIPSIRTPKRTIDLAIKYFDQDSLVLKSVDKQAYLSAFAISKNIIITCDSISMISEAATSGKPILVANMKPKKNNYRFKRFFKLFKDIGIIKYLGETNISWTYNRLNETERIAQIIIKKIKS